MHFIDYSIVVAYLVVLLFLGLANRLRRGSSTSDLIVGGRMLTLPAFVASLVSTWYGGILGVGEYSYNYGLSNWLVFGVPYYLAAFLFALFLAKKARESQLLTIPDQLARTYNSKTALAGAVVIYIMTVPAAYVLMLGVLCRYLFGWPMWVGVSAGTLFSIVYVFSGGFKSVVRTDFFQFALMFLGFVVLFVTLNIWYGGIDFVMERVPETHLTWHGGNSGWYVAVWYFIALATFIEPAFYQRCYAAKTSSIARRGIFISIICWAVFDFLTTSCGLYARAILPDLADPIAAYPALAMHILPAGLLGLFALALLSTIMSTVDSYSFLAASTFGNDIAPRVAKTPKNMVIPMTRIGLVISTLLAVAMALFFRSVIDIWHALGSIGTPALLVPVFFSFVGKRRLPGHAAFISIVTSALISGVWYFSRYISNGGGYWFDIEPIFPGLLWSIIMFLIFSKREQTNGLPFRGI